MMTAATSARERYRGKCIRIPILWPKRLSSAAAARLNRDLGEPLVGPRSAAAIWFGGAHQSDKSGTAGTGMLASAN
jgi:hypothetical protein